MYTCTKIFLLAQDAICVMLRLNHFINNAVISKIQNLQGTESYKYFMTDSGY